MIDETDIISKKKNNDFLDDEKLKADSLNLEDKKVNGKNNSNSLNFNDFSKMDTKFNQEELNFNNENSDDSKNKSSDQ